MTADVIPPWIDLQIRFQHRFATRYTHAHDFADGQISYNGLKLTEAQIKAYINGLNHPKLISKREFKRDRTRMTVTLTLYSTSLMIEALRLREELDIALRKHKHQAVKP